MSKTVKIVLGVLAVSVLLCMAAGVVGIFYGKSFIDSSASMMQDGEAFGATSTDRGCLEHVLILDKGCDIDSQPQCVIQHAMFVGACVNKAKHDPTVCQGVPGADSNNPIVMRQHAQRLCDAYPDAHVKSCPEYAGVILSQCARHRK